MTGAARKPQEIYESTLEKIKNSEEAIHASVTQRFDEHKIVLDQSLPTSCERLNVSGEELCEAINAHLEVGRGKIERARKSNLKEAENYVDSLQESLKLLTRNLAQTLNIVESSYRGSIADTQSDIDEPFQLQVDSAANSLSTTYTRAQTKIVERGESCCNDMRSLSDDCIERLKSLLETAENKFAELRREQLASLNSRGEEAVQQLLSQYASRTEWLLSEGTQRKEELQAHTDKLLSLSEDHCDGISTGFNTAYENTLNETGESLDRYADDAACDQHAHFTNVKDRLLTRIDEFRATMEELSTELNSSLTQQATDIKATGEASMSAYIGELMHRLQSNMSLQEELGKEKDSSLTSIATELSQLHEAFRARLEALCTEAHAKMADLTAEATTSMAEACQLYAAEFRNLAEGCQAKILASVEHALTAISNARERACQQIEQAHDQDILLNFDQ